MAVYKCYIDKQSSTFMNTKIKDRNTNKRVVLRNSSVGAKISFKIFLLYHSEDKVLFDKASDTYIEISGTQVGENKSTIFLTTNKLGQRWKIVKDKK